MEVARGKTRSESRWTFPLLGHDSRNEQDTSSHEVSFTAVIEQLKREKLEMATELNILHDQATKATELQRLAEEEAARSRLIIQAAEVDKQMLQQEVQNLTGMVEYFRNTIANSVHEVLNRLKLDLSLYTSR